MNHLYFDFETFSSEDISKSGAYKYTQSPDFEILLLAYAFDDEPVQVIDLTKESFPKDFIRALHNFNVVKHAHNANFERLCLKAYGIDVPVSQFECSAVKSLYCGLVASLDKVSKALNLNDLKDSAGKALIRYFCMPCKPTKTNGKRLRNYPEHDPYKWEQFKEYCVQDVITERAVVKALSKYELPDSEKNHYIVDQNINDLGVKVDKQFINNAIYLDEVATQLISYELKLLTGLENPNSGAQFKKWLTEMTGDKITTLAKEHYKDLFNLTDDPAVIKALHLYEASSKTSVAKYTAALNSVGNNDRIRGLLQFYGANRTGRYAGRLVQVQNLPRNYMSDLDSARELVKAGDFEAFELAFDNPKKVLSELIRTMFVAKENHIFCVMDFSAIEARVLAWLAGEQWRLDVFKSHGKIYEASASMMFNVPIEKVDKALRFKGKVAELALGYQGGVGAMTRMSGGELTNAEMRSIVSTWRTKNPKIVKIWDAYNKAAIKAIQHPNKVFWCTQRKISFEYDYTMLMIGLPSGRKLYYYKPKIIEGKYGSDAVIYSGLSDKNVWTTVDTYGGKFAENITQAVARDLLADALYELSTEGYQICMHIHDEVVIELPLNQAEFNFNRIKNIMSASPYWASNLPINAEGFLSPYYKKD